MRSTLDGQRLERYLTSISSSKQNLAQLDTNTVLGLMSITRDGVPTLAGVMLFSLYPQAYVPQLCIVATVAPGTEPGAVDEAGNRFLDNKRIEGTLSEQLTGAIAFVRSNMKVATHIDRETGKRDDREEYPIEAVRGSVPPERLRGVRRRRGLAQHLGGVPALMDARVLLTDNGQHISAQVSAMSVEQIGAAYADPGFEPEFAYYTEVNEEGRP